MADTLLDVQNVTHDFSLSKTACVRALDRLSFSILSLIHILHKSSSLRVILFQYSKRSPF